MSHSKTWRFEPVDTLFFRDSRPHNVSGAAVLGSLFPPSARTVAGAVRFLIGNSLGADWYSFGLVPEGEKYLIGDVDLMGLMGRYDDYGSLRFSGPWLSIETESGWRRLYPAPRHLLTRSREPAALIEIGSAVDCDLGRIRLPITDRDHRSAEDLWLDAEAYSQILAGVVPVSPGDEDPFDPGTERHVFQGDQLFDIEPRLGIGRDLDRFSAQAGLLYQTLHVRTRERSANAAGRGPRRLAIEIGVDGGESMPGRVADLVRLGGEGRMASVSVGADNLSELPAPSATEATQGLVLALLTPLPLEERGNRWLPPGFERRDSGPGQATVWTGVVQGVHLAIHTAVLGKAQREGGWDLAQRKPRAVRSLVPAGSVYFATIHDQDGRRLKGTALAPAVAALHLSQLVDQALGYSQIAIGTFDASVFPGLDSFHLDPI